MRTRALAVTLTLLGLLLVGTVPAPAADATYMPVRVEAGALARAGVEAQWVEHYGAFDWAGVSESDLGSLESSAGYFEAHPEVRTLVLPSASFDPLNAVPAGVGFSGSGESLQLVQFRAPTRGVWLQALRSRGARLVQPIAPFGYAVLADASSVASIRRLAFVRWAGAFDPSYRFGNLDLDGGLVNVVLLDGAGVASSIRTMSGLARSLRVTGTVPFTDVKGVGVQVDLSAFGLDTLTRLPNVYSISPQRRGMLRDEMTDQIVAGNYDSQGEIQPGYQAWLSSKNLNGSGVVVAHVDDGYSTAHPDTAGTVSGCLNYTVPTHTCNAATGTNSDFHGQHTGGIIVGTGTAPVTDPPGFRYGLGVAPGAKLFDQNYIALEATFGYSGPGQYQNLNKDSALGGATISANSWGPSGSPQGYDADTREFDLAPRDANLSTPQHEPITSVFSIMNGSGGTSTQGSPDEGKNLLRVGGSMGRGDGGMDDLCSCSAHGPALDGRILPDVVAPGERVISTANPATIALCLDPVGGPGIALYSSCTGTSMASPHVSGGAAVFTQYYRRQFGSTPSPALIKGAFVNGAVDLAGGRDANRKVMGHIPNNQQGWGRLNLENVMGRTEKSYVDQTVLLSNTGQSYTASVQPVDPSQPVKVTLAWTDAPGPGLGGDTPAWVNDLDLKVTAGTTTYLGNSFGTPSTGWSVSGGSADFMNNLENVYLQTAPSGAITVQVTAANLAGDGVPGTGDDTDQDFALIISNGRIAA